MGTENHDDPKPKRKLHLKPGSLADVKPSEVLPKDTRTPEQYDRSIHALNQEADAVLLPLISKAIDFYPDGVKVDWKRDDLGGAGRPHIDDAERVEIQRANMAFLAKKSGLTIEQIDQLIQSQATDGSLPQPTGLTADDIKYSAAELNARLDRLNTDTNPTTNRGMHMSRPAESWINHAINDIAGNVRNGENKNKVKDALMDFVYDVTQTQRDDHHASDAEVKPVMESALTKLKGLNIPAEILDGVLKRAEQVLPFIADEVNHAVSHQIEKNAFDAAAATFENNKPMKKKGKSH